MGGLYWLNRLLGALGYLTPLSSGQGSSTGGHDSVVFVSVRQLCYQEINPPPGVHEDAQRFLVITVFWIAFTSAFFVRPADRIVLPSSDVLWLYSEGFINSFANYLCHICRPKSIRIVMYDFSTCAYNTRRLHVTN